MQTNEKTKNNNIKIFKTFDIYIKFFILYFVYKYLSC